uniref:glucuronosyltransferase n=1 Tax=Coturnix japonica TaxID=93934 RepID=A0A8C2YBZ3_COTJA
MVVVGEGGGRGIELFTAAAGKLLVIPMDGSHWLSMKQVLAELSSRGHEIVVVAPDNSILIDSSEDYTMKRYPTPYKLEEMEELLHTISMSSFSEQPFLTRFLDTWENFKKTSAMFQSACSSLLHEKELMKFMEESKFDAVFTDPLTPCGQIVALHLSIPSIFFLRNVPCSIDIYAAQSPSPPSYVPRLFSFNTDHMTFPQRVKNFLISISDYFTCSIIFSPFERLASDFLQKPMTLTQLLSHGSIWLKRTDFAFDYPMPVMPSMVFIGGINCGRKKLLSQVSEGACVHLKRAPHISAGMALVLPSHPQVSVSLLLLLSVLSLAAGGKLLVMPVGGSHWLSLREVLVGLKQKGHEIVVVSPEFNLHVKASDNFTMKLYQVPLTEEEINGDFKAFLKEAFEEGSFLERFRRVQKRVKRLFDLGLIACEQLLKNKELIRYLEESNFDALFTDPVLPCGAIVAEHLSIPSVYLLRGIPCGLDIECPSPPSYIPRLFTDNTDHMNFLQRVKNVIFDTSNLFLCDFV